MEISIDGLKNAYQEFRKMDRGQLRSRVVTVLRDNMPKIKAAGAVAAFALVAFALIKLYHQYNPKKPNSGSNSNPNKNGTGNGGGSTGDTSNSKKNPSTTNTNPQPGTPSPSSTTSSSTSPSSTISSSTNSSSTTTQNINEGPNPNPNENGTGNGENQFQNLEQKLTSQKTIDAFNDFLNFDFIDEVPQNQNHLNNAGTSNKPVEPENEPSEKSVKSTSNNNSTSSQNLSHSCMMTGSRIWDPSSNLSTSIIVPGTDLTQSQIEQRDYTPEDLCKSTMNIDVQEQANTTYADPTQTIANALKAQVGGKLRAVYEASKKMEAALIYVKTNAPRIGNTAFTIMFGLGKIFDRQFALGAVALTSAVKEIYDLNSKNGIELDQVFNKIEDNFKVIDDLGKQNDVMLKKIGENIRHAKEENLAIASAFNEIQGLAVDGNEELHKLHGITQSMQEKAIETIGYGIDCLNKSYEKTEEAKRAFELCWKNIQTINLMTGHSLDDTDAIKTFTSLTATLETEFKRGMDLFNASQVEFQNGLTHLIEGQKLHCEVKCGVQLIKGATQEILNKIKSAAEQEKLMELQAQHLGQIEDLTNQVQAVEEQKKAKIEELNGNVKAVEDGINAHLQKQLIAAGFLAGFGAFIGGPVSAALAAAVGPALLIEAQKFFTPISDLVTDFELPQNSGEVKMGFYTQSTGYFARLTGKASNTAGIISIHVGLDIKHYHFNFNEVNHGLNIANLAKDLSDAMVVLSGEQVQDILIQLNNSFIQNPTTKLPMVSIDHPDLAELKMEIEKKKIQNEKEIVEDESNRDETNLEGVHNTGLEEKDVV